MASLVQEDPGTDQVAGKSWGTIDIASEPDLVRAAKANPANFAPLYLGYRDRVYAYFLTRTVNAEDAADLTQQVFVQALDALPRYRIGRTPFAAWLFRIARNLGTNYHARRRPSVDWDFLPEALHATSPDSVEEQAARGEVADLLAGLLRGCDSTTRQMLTLHFASGLTIAETAAAVGKSQAAVKKHITRTVHKLKEQYRDDDHKRPI